MISKEAVLARIDSLPPMSEAVTRLSSELRRDNWTPEGIERILKTDPGLTANLLRLANSAYFGCAREVVSVRHAVTLLGTRRVYEVAVSASLGRVLPPRLPGYEISSADFQVHCIAVAVLAERLAREVNVRVPELTFTAGLLHDIGKLVIGHFLAQESAETQALMRQQRMTFIEAERQILGYEHALIGATVARKWNFPEPIVLAALHHHDPELAAEESHYTLVALVHLADALAHTLGFGADKGELSRQIKVETAESLGLKVQRLEKAAGDSLAEIMELGALLGTKRKGG